MAAPFERRELPEQGFFGRLFGRVNREGLLAEVEAALADAEDWAAVPRAAIAAIEANYGGTLLADARDETMALVCRAADALSPQQIQRLARSAFDEPTVQRLAKQRQQG